VPETLAYETVLETVHQLPMEQQLSLVQTILQELSPPEETSYKVTRILEQALGLLNNGKPTPLIRKYPND